MKMTQVVLNVQALANSDSLPMVRVRPWNEPPMNNTKDDCRFVSYCYYPPR